MITDRSQRWMNRREFYRPNAELFDPSRLSVEVIHCQAQAKPFIIQHHYSGSMPASRLSIGLFQDMGLGNRKQVGVCVFSVPINNASIRVHAGLTTPTGQPAAEEACDLGRLVILDLPGLGGNTESYFVARALRLLRQHKGSIQSVISYADPHPRTSADGQIVKPGHIGQIYCSMSARLVGSTRPRNEWLMPDGRILSERSISKIVNNERGARHVLKALEKAGLGTLRNQDARSWLQSLQTSQLLRRHRNQGNLAYLMPLTRKGKAAARSLPSLPYPKLSQNRQDATVLAAPLLEGLFHEAA